MSSSDHTGFLILTIVGLFIIAIGFFLMIRTLRFVSRSRSTTGTVIDLEETHDEGVTYSPIVRFSTESGMESVFTDSVGTNPPMFKIGDEVKVLYLPDDPRKARVASPIRLYLVTIVLATIGGLLLATGLWGLSGGLTGE